MIGPTIKTASWFTKLPADHMMVGISRGTPRGIPAGYRVFRTLAPGAWFHSVSPVEYDRLYRTEVLDKLDPRHIAQLLTEMAPGRIPCMVCFENAHKKGDWCHRAMAALWLAEALGQTIPEYGFEDRAQTDHPCMPEELRRPTQFKAPVDLTSYLGRKAMIGGEEHEVIALDLDNPGTAIVQTKTSTYPAKADDLTRYFRV